MGIESGDVSDQGIYKSYLNRFSVIIEKDEDGYYAFVPELKGCYSQGSSYEEVYERIQDAIRLYVKDQIA